MAYVPGEAANAGPGAHAPEHGPNPWHLVSELLVERYIEPADVSREWLNLLVVVGVGAVVFVVLGLVTLHRGPLSAAQMRALRSQGFGSRAMVLNNLLFAAMAAAIFLPRPGVAKLIVDPTGQLLPARPRPGRTYAPHLPPATTPVTRDALAPWVQFERRARRGAITMLAIAPVGVGMLWNWERTCGIPVSSTPYVAGYLPLLGFAISLLFISPTRRRMALRISAYIRAEARAEQAAFETAPVPRALEGQATGPARWLDVGESSVDDVLRPVDVAKGQFSTVGILAIASAAFVALPRIGAALSASVSSAPISSRDQAGITLATVIVLASGLLFASTERRRVLRRMPAVDPYPPVPLDHRTLAPFIKTATRVWSGQIQDLFIPAIITSIGLGVFAISKATPQPSYLATTYLANGALVLVALGGWPTRGRVRRRVAGVVAAIAAAEGERRT